MAVQAPGFFLWGCGLDYFRFLLFFLDMKIRSWWKKEISPITESGTGVNGEDDLFFCLWR